MFVFENGGAVLGAKILCYTNGMNIDPANSAELSRRGLHFFVDNHVEQEPQPLSSEELIAGLAQHEDARLHLALIALFLYEPEVETAVFNALSLLDEQYQIQLKLFYTAATLLQPLYHDRLHPFISEWHLLPSHFSETLSLNTAAPSQTQLKQLGRHHRQLTGVTANWSGSYQYVAERLSTTLAKESTWVV